MDRFEEFQILMEGHFISTKRSRKRYAKFIDKLHTQFDARLDVYSKAADYIEVIDKKMADSDYATKTGVFSKDAKERTNDFKNVVNLLLNNGLTFDPLDLVGACRTAVDTDRFRADIRSPEGKELRDAVQAEFAAPDGELYKRAKEIHDRLYAADKNNGSSAVRKYFNNAVSARQRQALVQQQQAMLVQMMNMQQQNMQNIQMHQQMDQQNMQTIQMQQQMMFM